MNKKNLLLFLTLSVLVILLCSCSNSKETDYKEIKRTENAMSTIFEITVYDKNNTKASNAIDQAIIELHRIEKQLNYYSNDSELYTLNKNKELQNPSKDLFQNIEKANYYGNLSDGAFDITVQPILNLYSKTFSQEKRPPTNAEIKQELKKIDYKKINLSKDKIRIANDQEITLGGIAKGYAVEKMIDILEQNNISIALINAGGNMRAIGNKQDGTNWTIALENPRDKSNYITIVHLNNNAIATSGDYERYFNENKTFHHIVNPKTGYSATELISATVITDNAFDADALSTTIFVLGKEKGLALANKLNLPVLIIDRNRTIYKSENWKD